MRHRFFTALLALLIAVTASQSLQAATTLPAATTPDVQIVVTQKKIWIVADESPVKQLDVQLVNEKGKVVLEKQFSSKMVDWSIDIRELPAGHYQIMLNSQPGKKFVKEGPKV